ncbi:hypothetical protein PspLS_09967 [Pyricularia sp. CBS 133598]|nr:hypothetical protein PspLS_09967 [Pyricularia sp. CBS 133598]
MASFELETPKQLPFGEAKRPTELDQGSLLAFEWARSQFDKCLYSHSSCNNLSPKPPSLPTRVIDVGDDTTPPRLVKGHPAKGHWIALSHCWGGKIDNVTLKAKLAAKQRAMPLDELPPNFRDAIIATRALGRRDPSESLRLRLSSERIGWTGGVRLIDDIERSRASRSLSPLEERGWCLQEKCLPPRTLAYTELVLTWECLENTENEWDYTGMDYLSKKEKVVIRDFLPETPEGRVQTELLSDQNTRYTAVGAAMSWVLLVEAYSPRILTCSSDKLPAISGLAQVIARGLADSANGAYLAGLWRSSLLNGLSWSVQKLNDGRPAQPRCSGPSAYRAPSWSWASVDGPVSFPAARRTRLQPLQCNDDSSKYPGMAAVLEASVELKDRDQPYGQVIGGHIRLRALWLAVALHADDFSELREDGDPGYLRFGLYKDSRPDPSNLWADHVRVRPLVEGAAQEPESVCDIGGGLDVMPGPGERLLSGAERLCLRLLMLSNCTFLLLQPSERFPATFKRVGCANVSWNKWRGMRNNHHQFIEGEPIRFDESFIEENTAEVVIT